MDLVIKELTTDDIETIKSFYSDIFSNEPWNDDWSNEQQSIRKMNLSNYLIMYHL